MKPIQFNLSKIDNLSAEHNYLIQINTNQIRPWRNQHDSFMKCITTSKHRAHLHACEPGHCNCVFKCVRSGVEASSQIYHQRTCLALATRDSFASLSSSSCGCVGSTIELQSSKIHQDHMANPLHGVCSNQSSRIWNFR